MPPPASVRAMRPSIWTSTATRSAPYGLTVAQVYQQIAVKLTTTTTAETPVTVDGSTRKSQSAIILTL